MTLSVPGGTGCFSIPPPFSLVPSITCAFTVPSLGNAGFKIVGSGLCGVSFLAIGRCAATPATFPAGSPSCLATALGCLGFIDSLNSFVLLAPAAGLEWPLPIPNDPTLAGAVVCAQAVGYGTRFCGSCVAVSNGRRITVLP